jgi:hypothetical protein
MPEDLQHTPREIEPDIARGGIEEPAADAPRARPDLDDEIPGMDLRQCEGGRGDGAAVGLRQTLLPVEIQRLAVERRGRAGRGPSYDALDGWKI